MRAFVSLAGVVLLCFAASSASGTDEDFDSDLEMARGRGALLFQIHCATCHGLEGEGEGPLAKDLRIAPPQLTELVELDESGSPGFPAARLEAVIDGREEVRAHGSREMPIWGLTFQEPGRDGDQEKTVRRKIGDLLEYLRTIQAVED